MIKEMIVDADLCIKLGSSEKYRFLYDVLPLVAEKIYMHTHAHGEVMMPSSAVRQLGELVSEGKVELVNESGLGKKLLIMPIISVVAGSFMHFNCIIHDSVLYYHLHGEFMPITDDLGYFFFLAYLAAVYFIWTLVSIVFPIYRNVKRKC